MAERCRSHEPNRRFHPWTGERGMGKEGRMGFRSTYLTASDSVEANTTIKKPPLLRDRYRKRPRGGEETDATVLWALWEQTNKTTGKGMPNRKWFSSMTFGFSSGWVMGERRRERERERWNGLLCAHIYIGNLSFFGLTRGGSNTHNYVELDFLLSSFPNFFWPHHLPANFQSVFSGCWISHSFKNILMAFHLTTQ